MRLASGLRTAVLFLGLAPVRTALAQPPTPPPPVGAAAGTAAGATSSPDVVMLKNGGMLRGTIAELNPSASVTIVTVTGATQKIPIGEVSYAGPADRAPRPTSEAQPPWRLGDAPTVLAPGQAATFHFVSYQPLTLHLKTGGAFTPVCAAPCEATLPAGSHQLALSLGGGRPVASKELTVLPGPSTIEGNLESHKGQRTTGWVLFGTGLGLGALLIGYGLSQDSSTCSAGFGTTPGTTSTRCVDGGGGDYEIAGAILSLVGAGVGLALALRFDEATFQVTPAFPGAPAQPRN